MFLTLKKIILKVHTITLLCFTHDNEQQLNTQKNQKKSKVNTMLSVRYFPLKIVTGRRGGLVFPMPAFPL